MPEEVKEKLPYLAIHGWAKFQGSISKEDSARRPYVRTATCLDSDHEFSNLRMLPREVLEGCRRLVGLHGKNICNDPMWVSRALCVLPVERRFIPGAIAELIRCGFLIPSNEQDPFSEIHKDKIRKDKIREDKIVHPPAKDEPTEPAHEETVSESEIPKEKTQFEILAALFFKLLGQPKKFRNAAGDWEQSLATLFQNLKFTPEKCSSIVKFALEDDPFIIGYINKAADPMACFIKNIDNILSSWEVEEKVRIARAKKDSKSVPVKSAPGAHGNKSGFKL